MKASTWLGLAHVSPHVQIDKNMSSMSNAENPNAVHVTKMKTS
jgi:hypothetical protein